MGVGKMRDAGLLTGKNGKENAGEKYGTTGTLPEYKMWDVIATTVRRHEWNTEDLLYRKYIYSINVSK